MEIDEVEEKVPKALKKKELTQKARYLDDNDLKTLAKKCGFELHIIDLDKFSQEPTDEKGYYAIYTGNEDNAFNKGRTHHWLAGHAHNIFDPIGFTDWKIPQRWHFFTGKQFQPFNTNTCGEFVIGWLNYCYKSQGDPLTTRGYMKMYMLGSNKSENDDQILKFIHQLKK